MAGGDRTAVVAYDPQVKRGRKNIIIAVKPTTITRCIDADGEVNLMAMRNSTTKHRKYVVASMAAAAKRSGGEAGVTSRVTASPVRTKSS